MAKKPCSGCGSLTRKTPHPANRCATCHRVVTRARKEAARALRLEKTYGLKPGQYDLLYAAQGGVCALCLVARGVARKLAVDHSHKDGFVRGLLCSLSPCNKLLGHMRDDPDFAYRVADYLVDPPAHKTIGLVKANGV